MRGLLILLPTFFCSLAFGGKVQVTCVNKDHQSRFQMVELEREQGNTYSAQLTVSEGGQNFRVEYLLPVKRSVYRKRQVRFRSPDMDINYGYRRNGAGSRNAKVDLKKYRLSSGNWACKESSK